MKTYFMCIGEDVSGLTEYLDDMSHGVDAEDVIHARAIDRGHYFDADALFIEKEGAMYCGEEEMIGVGTTKEKAALMFWRALQKWQG